MLRVKAVSWMSASVIVSRSVVRGSHHRMLPFAFLIPPFCPEV